MAFAFVCWLLRPSGVVLRRPHALTAKICFDMVPGFGSYKLLLVCWRFSRSSSFKRASSCGAGSFLGFHFLIPDAVSVSCFFFPFDKRARKVLNPCAFCFLILDLSPLLFLIEFFSISSVRSVVFVHAQASLQPSILAKELWKLRLRN